MTAALRKGRSHTGPLRGLSPIGAIVRRHDPDRYQTVLFAPARCREGLFALYAFNYEVARVRESVTQPMLGQIRLQWWREVIEAAYAGTASRRHPVVEPLAAVIVERALSRGHFDRLIDAREVDLADQPPATLAALEDYCAATSSGLIQLALGVLGVDSRAADGTARGIGIAYALCGLLRAMRLHAGAGRCYVPADVAGAAGFDPAEYAALRPSLGLRRAAETLAAAAASQLAAARRHRREVPHPAMPALLPGVIAERALARLRRANFNPFDPDLAQPDPLLTWRLAGAMLLGRF